MNQSILEHGNYKQLLLKLSLPAVIIMIVMIIYNMADIFFIGQTGDANKIAAISLCTPIFTIISGLGTLFGNGGCTAISLALGKGETDKIKKYVAFSGIGAIIIGFIFMCVVITGMNQICYLLGATTNTILFTTQYLRIIALFAPLIMFSSVMTNVIRADGSTAQSMIANLLGTFTNILLDAIFILVFKLDIFGAAIATVIGNFVSFIYILWYTNKKQTLFQIHIKDFSLSSFTTIIPLGLPLACSTLLNSISVIIANRMIIGFGETALAAQGISSKIGMLITMLSMGICMGLQPAISYNYARGNSTRLNQIIKNTAIFTFILGTVTSLLCLFGRHTIISMFIQDDEVIRYGQTFVIGAIIIGPIYGIYQLCQTFLQSTGKASYSTVISVLDKGVVYLPILFLLSHLFGLYGIIFATSITLSISLVVAIFLSNKWRNSQQYAC